MLCFQLQSQETRQAEGGVKKSWEVLSETSLYCVITCPHAAFCPGMLLEVQELESQKRVSLHFRNKRLDCDTTTVILFYFYQ